MMMGYDHDTAYDDGSFLPYMQGYMTWNYEKDAVIEDMTIEEYLAALIAWGMESI